MTGAGSATVAYALEDEFGEGPGAEADWIQPGVDVSVTDLSVQQTLQRIRNPDDPRPLGSREGEWEGASTVEFTLTDGNFHDLVFADGGTALPAGVTRPPSATWYFAVELPDGTTEERSAVGSVVVDASVDYQQGEDVSVTLTMLHADEPEDVADPSTIEQPSVDDVFTYHGSDLVVDSTAQALMQSASLSLSNLARMRRGQNRKPVDAVVGSIEPSLSTDAVFTEADQQTLAYGSTSGGIDIVGSVDATLSFENGQGETIEYDLSGVQPTSYSWADLVSPDTDLSEPIDYHVADVEVV